VQKKYKNTDENFCITRVRHQLSLLSEYDRKFSKEMQTTFYFWNGSFIGFGYFMLFYQLVIFPIHVYYNSAQKFVERNLKKQ